MREEWRDFKLDQLGFVGRGRSRHRPRNDPRLYGGQYPFFQTGDVKAAELYLQQYEATYNELGLAQSKLWQPGTLCITIAANIAESAILAIPGCFPDSVVGFVADPKVADTKFVKYKLDTLKLAMQSASLGTTQDNLSLDKLLRFDFLIPTLLTQQRIAAILSAYDDLIENNTRRIAILEEMARRLYEEWFVHFRFPGHETAEFDGDLPKGWRAVDLGALVDDRRDAVQPYAVDPSTPYVGLEHIPRRSITLREWSEASTVQSTKLLFREDDILFGKIRPYFHKVVLAPLGGVTSSDTIVLRAYSADHLALAALCASSDAFVDHATQTSNGTKMPRADWKVLKSYPVALPDDALLARFNGFVLPLFATLKSLNRKNANLRAQRDLLLPKLVSGEIDVSGAEAELEAAE
ncbi:restriction endonuclease subunit S [Maritimibacter sp. 55A14]|uniref:restriction endonuclease subunit S n=1 Tax=Maritimibacter sp. 55A14 TaxID=2174844 RepID=UPI000D60358F|nr:restriction endonuclease subunit S [Maritimibacter sp. 55A14]PWE28423.1 restriction endonuclease subunit S [Maritimibacter sp. 55A14]